MLIQIIMWIFIMYGFLSLLQDIATEFTCKQYTKNIKVYICVYNFENEIENLEREIYKIKWMYKNISINLVNLDESITENEIKNFFEGDRINILSKSEWLEQT